MKLDFIPNNEHDQTVWMQNFLTVANAHLPALGLVATDTATLAADLAAFNTGITDVATKKAILNAAVNFKQQNRTLAIADARELARRIQAKPGVPEELITQLGLTVKTSHKTPVTPIEPSQLLVTGFSNGVNKLTWKANGNKPNTRYLVEALFGTSTDWQYVTALSATKFDHIGQTPGHQVTYRVSAQRRDLTSIPSNTATVYGQGSFSVVEGGQIAA